MLCHDDIEFITTGQERGDVKSVVEKLMKYQTYGIIGVAGGIIDIETDKSYLMRRWYEGQLIQGFKKRNAKDTKKMRNKNAKTFQYSIYDVFALDGLFLVIHKKRIKRLFDEQNKSFHFYDIDFCFANYAENVKIGVTYDLLIKHKSEGTTDKEHDDIRNNYFTPKWKHLLKDKKYHDKLVWVLHEYVKTL